jgi:phosphatidate cytidylyltransferase
MALGNTATRILVSAVAIPLILLVSYLGGIFFLVFVAAIGIISYYEFSGLVVKKSVYTYLPLGILSTILLIVNSYYRFVSFELLLISIVIVFVLIELFRNKDSAILNLGASFLGVLYIGLFSGTIISVREYFPENYIFGGYLIISLFITIWICDSAAFFLGTAFGKHKLFPRVSPKKSWEGAIAGFIFAVLTMITLKYILLSSFSLIDSIVIGTIIGSIGQIGDLVESLIKRDAGVKDSSNLIPGHGGIFDRFDSLMLSSPAIFLYLSFFK